MDWDAMTTTKAKTTRQKTYRFLLNRPEAVRALLRHLNEAEVQRLLEMLVDADNRRQAAAAKADAERPSLATEDPFFGPEEKF